MKHRRFNVFVFFLFLFLFSTEAFSQRRKRSSSSRKSGSSNSRSSGSSSESAKRQREANAQRQREEADAQRKREASAQREREAEAQRKREASAQREREADAQREREADAQREREADAQRERESQAQSEPEVETDTTYDYDYDDYEVEEPVVIKPRTSKVPSRSNSSTSRSDSSRGINNSRVKMESKSQAKRRQAMQVTVRVGKSNVHNKKVVSGVSNTRTYGHNRVAKSKQDVKKINKRRHQLNYSYNVVKRPRKTYVTRPYKRIVHGVLPYHHARHYGTYYYWRPFNYYHARYHYITVFHVPYSYTSYDYEPISYDWTSYQYYRFLHNNDMQHALYINWIFRSVEETNQEYQNNTFNFIDGYPYWVINGYMHRYSSTDTCNYQLIDKYSMRVVESYFRMTCNRGYDNCAIEKNKLNLEEKSLRFTCAETFRPSNYAYFNKFNKEDSHVGGYDIESYKKDYYYNDQHDLYYQYEYDEYETGSIQDQYYSDPDLEDKY